MSKGNTTENDFLEYTFKATAFSWNGNTNLYIALHTADPGEGGNATTSECAFGGYARATVSRSGTGWTVSGNTASNAGTISFPECSSGSETVQYISITTASSGTSQILYSGALSASRSVSSGITLQFAAGALDITED